MENYDAFLCAPSAQSLFQLSLNMGEALRVGKLIAFELQSRLQPKARTKRGDRIRAMCTAARTTIAVMGSTETQTMRILNFECRTGNVHAARSPMRPEEEEEEERVIAPVVAPSRTERTFETAHVVAVDPLWGLPFEELSEVPS